MITFRKSCGLQRCSWQPSKSHRHASNKEDILCRISPPAPLSKSREFVVLRASDGKEITANLEECKKTNQIVSKFFNPQLFHPLNPPPPPPPPPQETLQPTYSCNPCLLLPLQRCFVHVLVLLSYLACIQVNVREVTGTFYYNGCSVPIKLILKFGKTKLKKKKMGSFFKKI